jgi:hypothetical protein
VAPIRGRHISSQLSGVDLLPQTALLTQIWKPTATRLDSRHLPRQGDDLLIVNAISHYRGWIPVQHVIAIAGELFDCEVVMVDASGPSKTAKILSVLRQRTRNGASDETCLLVCNGPRDLLAILNIENWRKRFRHMAAWVIDSFWLDHIPRAIRLHSGPVRHLNWAVAGARGMVGAPAPCFGFCRPTLS